MAKLTNLTELLIDELQDLLSAENQLTKALPKMADAALHESLKSGFLEHLEQTKTHVERVERAIELLGGDPKPKKCKAMQGLIDEGEEKIDLDADSSLRDAALIGAAQKVEHYEIAGYGTARTFAQLLGRSDVADILETTLREEAATDEKLTELAEAINADATQAADRD